MHNKKTTRSYLGICSKITQIIMPFLIVLLVLLVIACNNSNYKTDNSENANIKALVDDLIEKYDAATWKMHKANGLLSASIFTIELKDLLMSGQPMLFYLTLKDIHEQNDKYIAVFEFLNPFESSNIIFKLACTEAQKDSLILVHKSDTFANKWINGYAVIANIESLNRFSLTLKVYTENNDKKDDGVISYVDINPEISPSYFADGILIDFAYINGLFHYIITKNKSAEE